MSTFANLPMSSSDAANQRLEDVMEEMAGGHIPAIMHFWQEFSSKMCRTLRGILRELDQRDLAADAEYVRDLAFESCWVIFDRAPQWNSEDDPPWQWARPLLVGWTQDWLEQAGVVDASEPVGETSDFAMFEEFSYEDDGIHEDIGQDGDAAGDAAGDSYPLETDSQPSTDTGDLTPEFTISGESRSMGDRFDEALGLRPKTKVRPKN